MAKQAIKDNRNRTIGYVDSRLNGESTVYDASNRTLGKIKPQGNKLVAYDKRNSKIAYWDERQDATYDARGRKLGKGNSLVAIIMQSNV